MSRYFIVRICALMVAALVPLGLTAASAQAATGARAVTSHAVPSHAVASHAVATHAELFHMAAARVVCVAPAHNFCVFSNAACTANPFDVAAQSFHSQWFRFEAIGVPYNPQCILNPTNSSIWAEDEATEFARCAAPGVGIGETNEQFGFFFVKFNIPTCGSEPAGE